jgi:Lon protease-like protein
MPAEPSNDHDAAKGEAFGCCYRCCTSLSVPPADMPNHRAHHLLLLSSLALRSAQGLVCRSSGALPHLSKFLGHPRDVPSPASPFQLPPPPSRPRTLRLWGISEWRDLVFNFPGSGDDRRLGREQGAPPREVCILPFPFTDVLLQGETKQLRLYEDRFIKLFETSMQKHEGVVAMGLLADSGIIQTVPLCEIEAYNRLEGFGIFVTIRAVSRAQLLEVVQQEPYLRGVCVEIADKLPPNLELPNLVAHNIENLMVLLSSMEHRLAQAGKDEAEGGSAASVLDEDDREMQRRIALAKLVRMEGGGGGGGDGCILASKFACCTIHTGDSYALCRMIGGSVLL